MHYVTCRDFGAGVQGFWDQLMTGFPSEGVTAIQGRTEAGLKLRGMFINWSQEAQSKTPSRVKWMIMVKALHRHLAGEMVGALRWSIGANEHPLPVVPDWWEA